MDKQDIQFEIDQLRKDKIIYAVEACAVVLVCLLTFFFSNAYFPSGLKDTANVVVFVIGIAYTLFMGVGNFFRLQKIKKLQEKLKK